MQRSISQRGRTWAILLAAGEGSRVAHLTRGVDGAPVPKQFCSIHGRTLLEMARQRARQLVPDQRMVTVVARRHRRWWEAETPGVAGRIVVQPDNRGTAAGLLLPLLHVGERDPDAIVWIVPSDHWVADEPVLASAVHRAIERVRRDRDRVVLLSMAPDGPETQYGWIVPGRADVDGIANVNAFVEKPSVGHARQLLLDGAGWNSFLLVGRIDALLALYARRCPGMVEEFLAARNGGGLESLYQGLPRRDFSRDVLEGSEQQLLVLQVPACGWTDLGTPERLLDCLNGEALRVADLPAAAIACVG